ncbi:MAG: amidohydrolase family protein [Armatimonadota bacterium]
MARDGHLAATALAVAALAGVALGQDGPVREKVAVKAGTIITVSGSDIEGGIILIEDGRITKVGTGVEIPWDANVIEASDKVVMPGFVEAHTSQGMRTANERELEVPFISAFDGIDPISWFIEDSLRDGVTTMLVLPGNDTLLGGTGVVVKPDGMTVEDMLVRNYTGLKISLQPRSDSSRMAHLARLREYFADLNDYVEQYEQRKADAEEADKPFDEEIDAKKQPVIDLLEGKLTAFVYCPRASDVAKAFELSEQHEFAMVPVLGADCYKAADLLAEKGLPVILDSRLIVWETDEETETEEMKVVPKIMAEAGVKFALQRSTGSYGGRYFWFQAAQAVAHGVGREEALKSVTLYPAEIIGVADRVGSIEAGKDANLLILTGDPLDAQTWVDQVLIEGKVVYDRAEDERLKRLLEKPKLEEEEPPVEDEGEEETAATEPEQGDEENEH